MSTNKYKSISYIDRIKNKKYKVVPEVDERNFKMISTEDIVIDGHVKRKTVFKTPDVHPYKGLKVRDFSISNLKSIGASLSPVTMTPSREFMEDNLIFQCEKIASHLDSNNNNN